jgi:serine/threonine-protein kinase ULK/ATG1
MQESEKKGTLSLYGFKNNRVDLASTNCSVDIEDCDKSEKLVSQNKGKKRIGPYSYYLKNIIGSGYGGRVYKGIRDNNKTVWYAIKIIKLKDMNLANIYLLNSEIAIIQQLEHPNIIKFVDVYYTQNHCYLITEYCEGGNLEKYIKCKENVEWGTIIYQISQGCQYLANKNIVHRDLKPANIFLKNGVWKIGDFGFSKKISHSAVLII